MRGPEKRRGNARGPSLASVFGVTSDRRVSSAQAARRLRRRRLLCVFFVTLLLIVVAAVSYTAGSHKPSPRGADGEEAHGLTAESGVTRPPVEPFPTSPSITPTAPVGDDGDGDGDGAGEGGGDDADLTPTPSPAAGDVEEGEETTKGNKPNGDDDANDFADEGRDKNGEGDGAEQRGDDVGQEEDETQGKGPTTAPVPTPAPTHSPPFDLTPVKMWLVPLPGAKEPPPTELPVIMPFQFDPDERDESPLESIANTVMGGEPALCYQHARGDRPRLLLHIVLTTNWPADTLPAQLETLSLLENVTGVQEGGLKGEWVSWTFETALLRSVPANIDQPELDLACYAPRITLVAPRTERADIRMEHLVDAALRTHGGRIGKLFVVLPSFIVPTRAAYTLPDPATDEMRYEATGFVEALLGTFTSHNEGRVAATQCTILRHLDDSDTEVPVPVNHLSEYTVLDRGAFIGATTDGKRLLPFLTRRYATYRGHDQRILFEEPVDAVSLFCGAFHRQVYEHGGGIEEAVALGTPVEPVIPRKEPKPRFIHTAGDAVGWKVTLRVQRHYPTWQVWSSRAVGVWRPRRPGRTGQRTDFDYQLNVTSFALTDWYGKDNFRLITRLQQRRFGVPWRQRGEYIVDLNGYARTNGTTPSTAPLTPSLRYFMDFPCVCCGLGREASGYTRPLMERYVFGVDGHDYCPRPGSALQSMGFAKYNNPVFGMDDEYDSFWAAQLRERVQLSFLHSRARNYERFLRKPLRSATHNFIIGRSLSEFSNVPDNWIEPLRSETDEVWVTAEFFRTVYGRQGVPKNHMYVVPEAVDVYEYDPANTKPLPLPIKGPDVYDNHPELTAAEREGRYIFLSNFKWETRKGWDILLGAYWDAFGPDAPVELQNRTTLMIKVNFKTHYSAGLSTRNLATYLESWVERTKALKGFTSMATFPHLVVIGRGLSDVELIRMYATGDAFVFPSRGEGWGLPAAEAMSMGLPVIISAWSGLLGFMAPDTCFPIAPDGLEELPQDTVYGFTPGMKWAMPSRNRTAALMQYVLLNPDHATNVGHRARQHMIQCCSEEAVADTMDARMAAHVRAMLQGKTASPAAL